MRARQVVFVLGMAVLTACSAPPAASQLVASPSASSSPSATPPDQLVMPRNIAIVVATREIPGSTQLTADMVMVAFYSADQAPPFAFEARELVIGKFTVVPIHVGQAITDNLLSPTATAAPMTVPVVVATRDIAQSTQLTRDMLRVAVYSPDQAPPFAFRTPDAVVGKFTIIPIHTNQAFTDNVLSTKPVTCPSPHS